MAIDYNSPAVISEARRKLAYLYARSDTRQRTQLGRRLGYKGKPESARRAVRRLATFTIRTGEAANINAYFRPYTTLTEPDPYLGVAPPYSISGKAQISAFVMYVIRVADSGGYEYFDTRTGWINTAHFTEMSAGMRQFQQRVIRQYFDDEEYYGLEAIAFSESGIEQLLSLPEYDSAVPPREPADNFGIMLYSTTSLYGLDGKRQPYEPPAVTGRPFPKKRRKEMIQYINRAYGQRSRSW